MVAAANQMSIYVLSDDTDVFVLLLYDCFVQKLKLPVIMESPIAVPKIASLSPTKEAFTERNHQAYVWKHALTSDPPDMSPTDFGWLFYQ